MNEQEAIERLKVKQSAFEYQSNIDKAFGMAIKALKKQIGLKPLENIVCFYCPKCKHFVESVYNYCGFCGQKLDWSEEE